MPLLSLSTALPEDSGALSTPCTATPATASSWAPHGFPTLSHFFGAQFQKGLCSLFWGGGDLSQ